MKTDREKSPDKFLTDEEAAALQCSAKGGFVPALERLIKRNNELVYKIASHYFGQGSVRGFAPEDIVQVGNLGLFKACISKTFDPNKAPFKTYAAVSISRAILGSLKLRRSIDDFMETIDVDQAEVADIIPDEDITPIERIVELDQLSEKVRFRISRLKSNHNKLLGLLYGINQAVELKSSEIAKESGVSRQSVSRKKITLLEKLREDPEFIDLWTEYLEILH